MVADRPKKVLLIGWDAADWKVAAPMMDAGVESDVAVEAAPAVEQQPMGFGAARGDKKGSPKKKKRR